ncbi:MAG: nucleoside phosphorylase [Anaerolineaceae bacterium]|nr:nucleoside phosphorylase [Anaerolineaceae bacterium]
MAESTILNKEEKTLGKIQYHTHIRPGDVGKYVLLPGDPDRVLRIAKYLDNAHEIAFNREHRTWTGTYKGITVSATSTGMGCPSTAIAVEELANVGATHFIRVGSTGALQAGINIGDLIINTGSMRLDGSCKYYVHDGFPAIADHYFTHALIETALDHKKAHSYGLHVGLGTTTDAFYGETPELIQMMIDHHMLNVEMESSVIYTIAHRRGLKAATVCAVSGNLKTGDVIYEEVNTRLAQGWEDAIQVALDGICSYEAKGYEALSNSLLSAQFETKRYHPVW